MTHVITYQHAYLPGQRITLCARHEHSDDPLVAARFGSLGPVSHGQHWGICAICRIGDERTERAS